MKPFDYAEVEDKHFPLPLESVELLEMSWDPTYGIGDPTPRVFCVCQTCYAVVQAHDTTAHAKWHG